MYCSYTAFVDKKYGNDETGRVEISCRPFATILAAVKAVNVSRFSNPLEGWVVKISPGIYEPIDFNNVFSIDFQGSGIYTSLGRLIFTNCKPKPTFSSLSIRGLSAPSTAVSPMLLGAPLALGADSAISLVESEVSFVDVSVFDDNSSSPTIWSENSVVDFASSVIESRSNSLIPTIVFTGDALASRPSSFSSVAFNIESMISSAVILNESSSTKIVLDNNSFNIASNEGESSIFQTTGGVLSEIVASNNLVTGGTVASKLLNALPGGLAITRNNGDGKVAVSATRMEFAQATEVSQNTGSGETTVQLTARGSNIAPVTEGNFVNENTNDKSKSLWMEGGLSLGTLFTQVDAVIEDNHYLCYFDPISVDINISLPLSSERIGRQLALSVSSSSQVSGKKVYIRPPVGDTIVFGTQVFTNVTPLVLGYGGLGEYVNVKLYSIQSTAGTIWLMTL